MQAKNVELKNAIMDSKLQPYATSDDVMFNYPAPFDPRIFWQQLPLRWFIPDVKSITQDDIEPRYKVTRTFLAHPEKVLGMLIQNGAKRAFPPPRSVENNAQVYSPYEYKDRVYSTINYDKLIFIKPSSYPVSGFLFPVSGWIDGIRRYCGYDIVSFHAFNSDICYKDALVELNDTIESRQFLSDDKKRKSDIKWHVQVKNSVSSNSTVIDDNFYSFFMVQFFSNFIATNMAEF